MLKYYVYELVNSLTGNVFYLGKGSGDRIDQHEKDARKPGSTYKLNKIRSIWRKGGKVIKRKVGLFVNEREAYKFESELIAEYGIENLTNVSPCDKRVHSKEWHDLKWAIDRVNSAVAYVMYYGHQVVNSRHPIDVILAYDSYKMYQDILINIGKLMVARHDMWYKRDILKSTG